MKFLKSTKIEIKISDEELGFDSSASFDGEMLSIVEVHEILPIEKAFMVMVDQISYKEKKMIPDSSVVDISIVDEEQDIYVNSQCGGDEINELYESNQNGITIIFDLIVESLRDKIEKTENKRQ